MMLSIDPAFAAHLAYATPAWKHTPEARPAGSDYELIGLPRLMKRAFDGEDLAPLGAQLIARAQARPDDANALMDLSIVLQLGGNRDLGLVMQGEALAMQQLYHLAPASGHTKLRLLALMTPGDLSANTPLEFLLEGQDIALDMLYLAPGLSLPETVPDHDVLLVAACESEAGRPALDLMRSLVSDWSRPVVNRPECIVWVERQKASGLLNNICGVDMPLSVRISRASLEQLGRRELDIADLLSDGDFPIIVRPLDSHAGHGLAKMERPENLAAYLAIQEESEFHIARFVDYQSDDGWYRKYRVVLMEGRAYACHMAVSRHWMIHYLNADMVDNPDNRAQEAAWMEHFDTDFGLRHRTALAEVQERLGLDYLCIDCAETQDGQLLIFEVDSGAVVHAMDPESLFPYKKPQMHKIFNAFGKMLAHKRDLNRGYRLGYRLP